MTTPERYSFGGFTLDVAERRLSADGAPLTLAPKAFDLLVAMVRRAGRLLTKRELLATVWSESFVEEGILTVHVSALRKALRDTTRPPRYIETVARSGYRFIAPVTESRQAPRVIPGRWSIAVLPARSLSGSTDGEHLIGLAITDALIDRLGRFNPLAVRPTGAVDAYRSGAEDPAAVGRTLRSDAVVDASFERMRDGVRLSARLLRCDDGGQIWSGCFEDSAGNLAATAVADAVAAELGATLYDPSVHSAETVGMSPVPQTRLRVYELCGRGRAHLLSASMVEVPKAVEAYREAVAVDPTYAPAHAGLALACCAQASMRVALPLDAYRDARAAALRALAADAGCADAQVALGSVLFFAEWDWQGAEQCLRRVVDLNPSHVQGHLLYGRLLDALGRAQEALDMKLRAFECDPLSPLVHVQIALCYWNQRQYDEAIEWANRAVTLDPRHLLAREFLAGAYLKKGDFDRYLAEVIDHAACAGVAAAELDPLKATYAAGGASRFWTNSLEQMSASPNVPPLQLAVFAAQAGDIDTAFLHLDRAIGARDPSLVDLAVAPQWDPLRHDSRFEQSLSRMGLQAVAASSITIE